MGTRKLTVAGSTAEKIHRRPWLGLTSLMVLIVIWEAWARLSGWSVYVFPDPLCVLNGLWELTANGMLFKHTVASLFRVTVGFYSAILLGVPAGILISRLEILYALMNPVIQFLRPISPLAWIPLAMLWFGIGDPPAIFLIFLASIFPIVVATSVAVKQINPTFFQVAANFNFNRFEIITKLILPAIMPQVITALRLTITISWLVVVAAEMIAVQSGLGFLIMDSRNALRMDYVMDGMIVIGLIGLSLDHMMKWIGDTEFTRWGILSR